MLPGLRGWPFIFAFFLAVVLVLGTHLKGVMADDGAAAPFLVKFDIAGSNVPEGASFLLKVEPSWAPRGAKRFRELVEAKFYDDTRFFRVLDGMYDIWIAQFGVRPPPPPARPPAASQAPQAMHRQELR